MFDDTYFMNQALAEARKAFDKGEVPIGAVIVVDDKIIARGYNLRESSQNVIKHAEIVAIEKACKKLSSWRLEGATIYVTQEPCPMCAGAIIQSRIKNLVYGTTDPKNGAHVSQVKLFDIPFNHLVSVKNAVLAEESKMLIKDFFIALRNKKNTL